jgi:hypothetical protein
MGSYYLLKSNGGDSGNRIFVLYWRCPLIRGSSVLASCPSAWHWTDFDET